MHDVYVRVCSGGEFICVACYSGALVCLRCNLACCVYTSHAWCVCMHVIIISYACIMAYACCE